MDSAILPISVIRRIIPVTIVIVAIVENGFIISNNPKTKWTIAVISINAHVGEAADLRLNANWNLTINWIICHAPIITPKNSFKMLGLNIKKRPIIVYIVPCISSVLIVLFSMFEVKYETIWIIPSNERKAPITITIKLSEASGLKIKKNDKTINSIDVAMEVFS